MKKQKIKIPVLNKVKTGEVVTEEQVKEVFKFAEFLYGLNGQGNTYTPLMVNSILKRNTMSQTTPNEKSVEAALSNPQQNEKSLLGYNEYAELTNMIYKRTLLYYANLLSYNLDIDCINIRTIDEFKNKDYLADLEIVEDFFNRFDVVEQFTPITKQLLRQDICVCLWRNDCEKFLFQEFPQAYSVITGRWEYGNLIDIDMTYFLQPGVSLDMYPDEFKKYYNRIFGANAKTTGYNPAASLYNRDGTFAQYTQTDPYLVWGFKMDNQIATRVPFLSAMLPDAILQPYMRELQKNSNIIAASKIIAGEIGMKKDNRGAVVQDAIAFNPETLGKFLAVMKSGLCDLIQLVAAPLENIKGIEYDTKDSKDIYSIYQKNLASAAGNSRLLFSTESANAIESQYIMNMDENTMRPIYTQYENFLNYTVNKLTKKYKFKFRLKGFNDATDKKTSFEKTKYWAEKGFLDLDGISHSLGMNNKFQLLRKLNETKAYNVADLLTLLPNMYTMTSNGVGRPKTEVGENVSESGEDYNPQSNDSKLDI